MSVLCNLAEAYIWMGLTDKAQEVLSAALQAVEVHNKAVGLSVEGGIVGDSGNSSTSTSTSTSSIGGDITYMPMQHSSQMDATLGRVLSLHALLHHRTGRAVMAEGLYRSAIDKLSHRSVAKDPRFKYELCVAEGLYGLLLHKWDRREKEGVNWTTKALGGIASIRGSSSCSSRSSSSSDGNNSINNSSTGSSGDINDNSGGSDGSGSDTSSERQQDGDDMGRSSSVNSSDSDDFILPYFQYPF